MPAKMKSCFSAHVLMHSLFGLGLGLLVAAIYYKGLKMALLGVAVMVIAVILDAMRKE